MRAYWLMKALPKVEGEVTYNNPNLSRPFPLRLESASVRVLPVSNGKALSSWPPLSVSSKAWAWRVCRRDGPDGAGAGGVLAGAWDRSPAGQGQIIETLFGWAGDGPPYGGVAGARESRIEAQTYIEYGLADRLTVVGQAALERYELTAPSADVFRGLDYSSIGLRANLWSNDAVVISAEATGFVPGARDFSRPAQAGNTGGAGEARALVGYNFTLFATPAFLDAEGAFRLRWRRAARRMASRCDARAEPERARDVAVAELQTRFPPWSSSPIFPAWSSYGVQLSIVYALDEHWSVQAGAFATFATVETNSQHGLPAAIWRKFLRGK